MPQFPHCRNVSVRRVVQYVNEIVGASKLHAKDLTEYVSLALQMLFLQQTAQKWGRWDKQQEREGKEKEQKGKMGFKQFCRFSGWERNPHALHMQPEPL